MKIVRSPSSRRSIKCAVCEREDSLGHRDRRLRGLLFVRIVERGKPVTRVFVLALRPRMANLVGVFRRGVDEEQPVTRPVGTIDDAERGALVGHERRIERDCELIVAQRKSATAYRRVAPR